VPAPDSARKWPRRIVHVTPFLWSGAGGALVRLAEAQRAAGSEVTVVTTGRSRGGSDWPAQRQRLRRAGVAHVRLDFFAREPAVFWPSVEALGRLWPGSARTSPMPTPASRPARWQSAAIGGRGVAPPSRT